ncbi:ABC transporter permease [Dysgonomonas termitidis]|uniref:ABC transporter permease n=1 Tax=Dysgonomonas termitidis TaxID=1516126 RepID=A0ABV9L3Z9_9BACT
MYSTYFKQAIAMLKQNKFISTITIAGTALAIMMIMVIIVSESIKNTSIAPEINRERTMYIKYEIQKSKNSEMWASSAVDYKIYKDYLAGMPAPELTSAIQARIVFVTAEHKKERQETTYRLTDYNFWKIMAFTFIEGKPFTKEDHDSGLKKAIISESTAYTLFGYEPALGKTIEANFIPYTVTGIVKDVSPVFTYAHADVYVPYTSHSGFDQSSCTILILAKDRNDFNTITEEVREAERKADTTDPEYNLTLIGPYDHRTQLINTSAQEPDIKADNRKTVFIFVILLLIPAVNLSGFSMSRIKKRTEEIGIRKAFGAKRYMILFQVLYENLITSLIGSAIGLILSYIVVIWLKDWLLDLESGDSIPLETFVSFPVFLAVSVILLLLNMLSAGLPAYRASKIAIVDSINQNNR